MKMAKWEIKTTLLTSVSKSKMEVEESVKELLSNSGIHISSISFNFIGVVSDEDEEDFS